MWAYSKWHQHIVRPLSIQAPALLYKHATGSRLPLGMQVVKLEAHGSTTPDIKSQSVVGVKRDEKPDLLDLVRSSKAAKREDQGEFLYATKVRAVPAACAVSATEGTLLGELCLSLACLLGQLWLSRYAAE